MRRAFLSGLVLILFVFLFHVSSFGRLESAPSTSKSIETDLNAEASADRNQVSASFGSFKRTKKNATLDMSEKPAFYDLVGKPDDVDQLATLPENGED